MVLEPSELSIGKIKYQYFQGLQMLKLMCSRPKPPIIPCILDIPVTMAAMATSKRAQMWRSKTSLVKQRLFAEKSIATQCKTSTKIT